MVENRQIYRFLTREGGEGHSLLRRHQLIAGEEEKSRAIAEFDRSPILIYRRNQQGERKRIGRARGSVAIGEMRVSGEKLLVNHFNQENPKIKSVAEAIAAKFGLQAMHEIVELSD